jgi:hypothetical protein
VVAWSFLHVRPIGLELGLLRIFVCRRMRDLRHLDLHNPGFRFRQGNPPGICGCLRPTLEGLGEIRERADSRRVSGGALTPTISAPRLQSWSLWSHLFVARADPYVLHEGPAPPAALGAAGGRRCARRRYSTARGTRSPREREAGPWCVSVAWSARFAWAAADPEAVRVTGAAGRRLGSTPPHGASRLRHSGLERAADHRQSARR